MTHKRGLGKAPRSLPAGHCFLDHKRHDEPSALDRLPYISNHNSDVNKNTGNDCFYLSKNIQKPNQNG